MRSTIRQDKVKVNRKIRGPHQRLKRGLVERGKTYHDVARLADVSWFMVWAVLNKKKTSQKVLDAARVLAGANGVAA